MRVMECKFLLTLCCVQCHAVCCKTPYCVHSNRAALESQFETRPPHCDQKHRVDKNTWY